MPQLDASQDVFNRWAKAALTPLSREDAVAVWDEAHGLGQADERIGRLMFLLTMLERECVRGVRCAVCGRANDSRCATEC